MKKKVFLLQIFKHGQWATALSTENFDEARTCFESEKILLRQHGLECEMRVIERIEKILLKHKQ